MPEEYAGWWHYWKANPEHHERADFRNAKLMSLLCTLKEDKIPKNHDPINFMPFSKQPEEVRQTPEQAEAIFRHGIAHLVKAVEHGNSGKS